MGSITARPVSVIASAPIASAVSIRVTEFALRLVRVCSFQNFSRSVTRVLSLLPSLSPLSVSHVRARAHMRTRCLSLFLFEDLCRFVAESKLPHLSDEACAGLVRGAALRAVVLRICYAVLEVALRYCLGCYFAQRGDLCLECAYDFVLCQCWSFLLMIPETIRRGYGA